MLEEWDGRVVFGHLRLFDCSEFLANVRFTNTSISLPKRLAGYAATFLLAICGGFFSGGHVYAHCRFCAAFRYDLPAGCGCYSGGLNAT